MISDSYLLILEAFSLSTYQRERKMVSTIGKDAREALRTFLPAEEG
jgi:hypothetical protein